MLLAGGCASMPDTEFLTKRYALQAAKFKSALGPLSAKQSAALVAKLKRQSGDLDLLDKQITLEQEIGGGALVTGNRVVLLQDGPATYAAMFAAIRAAKEHINVESYIIEDGEIGQQFADLLIARQAEGVQVNVLYDSAGGLWTGSRYFERLRQAGVEVVEFNPINPLVGKKPWRLTHRDHRKLLIVDGKTAFLGGINISGVYSSGSSFLSRPEPEPGPAPVGWRDTDIQVDGPVVAEFQRLFLESWNKQGGRPVGSRGYFPVLEPQGPTIVRAIGSTPDAPFSLIYLTLISAIMNSEKQICIANAYFVPDPQLRSALIEAAARGVDVRLVLPSRSDSKLALYAGRSYYAELLRGGVKIHERRGAPLHVKTAMIDGIWSCVGSSNLDWRSALDNDEINAIILGREFAAEMAKAYDRDLLASDEITWAEWRRRSLWPRMKESWARLFSRML